MIENKEKIILAAIEEFYSKGISTTKMAEVAEVAKYDRRTLYRYFKTKDELILETIVYILDGWNKLENEILNSLIGDGLAKFVKFYKEIVSHTEFIKEAKIVTEFDMSFNIDEFAKDESHIELVNKYYKSASHTNELVLNFLEEGIEDGSIRELDAKKAAAVIQNVLWSIIQKTAVSSSSINDLLHIDFYEIIDEQLSIYMNYLSRR